MTDNKPMTERNNVRKVALAYSGGLDTSIIIPWLKETYDCEVHAVCGDVGQGDEELQGLVDKARKTGAASCEVVDLKREFLEGYVWPCLRALTVYEGRYLLGTSMARPILAKAQVDYARKMGCDAVAHGCTGKGNDQVRFELTYKSLAPDLTVISPWREWTIASREDAIDYAEKHKVPITASRTKIYSRDRNLWHISHEGGAIEHPDQAPPEDAWVTTVAPEKAPDRPELVRVSFQAGVPTGLDGRRMDAVDIVMRLNRLGGAHGVGRVDITENRVVGMKSRGIYETPGGTVIVEALRTLRSLTLDRYTMRLCEKLSIDYADMVYAGRWFTPERESLDAFFAKATEWVTGEVTVKLFKGVATSQSAVSPYSLFAEDLATFGQSARYRHADSAGFMNLYGLPALVTGARARNASKRQP